MSFLQEVGMLASIQHPNCCQLIHAAYDTNGSKLEFALLFETLDQDLTFYLRHTTFNEVQRFQIAQDIVSGLLYLHTR